MRPAVGVPAPADARPVGSSDDGDGGGGGLPSPPRGHPVQPALTARGDGDQVAGPADDWPLPPAAPTGVIAQPTAGTPPQAPPWAATPSSGLPADAAPAPATTAAFTGHDHPLAAEDAGTASPRAVEPRVEGPPAADVRAPPGADAAVQSPLPPVAALQGEPVTPLRLGVGRQPPVGTPPVVLSPSCTRWFPAVPSPSGTRWSPAGASGTAAPAGSLTVAARSPPLWAVSAPQTGGTPPPSPPAPTLETSYSLWPAAGTPRDSYWEPLLSSSPARSQAYGAVTPAASPLAGPYAPPSPATGHGPPHGAGTSFSATGVSPVATPAAASIETPPPFPPPAPPLTDAAPLPLPTLSTVESSPLAPQLPPPPGYPGAPSPLFFPPGTDMAAVVAAALTAPTPNFPDPLWPPFTDDLREVHAWRSAVTDAAAAATMAVGWRRAAAAAAAAVPAGVVPLTASSAATSAAAAADTATTASAVMRRAAQRVTVYPLLVAGAPATALPIRDDAGASPFAAPTPCAVTPSGTPDVRAVLTQLAAAEPGGELPPITLVTAVALLHRFQGVNPVGAVMSPYTAGRLLAAALLATRHTPGVPPLPAVAVTWVAALDVPDVDAAADLEAALVTRLGERGAVVELAEQEATTWLLLWHWGRAV